VTTSRVLRVAVPDLISNSYFPAVAAVELGLLAEEGVPASLELLFPVTTAAQRLVEGEIDLLAGAAHAPLYVQPRWDSVKLAASLAQHMYWFLVVGQDSSLRHGDLATLSDLRIGAAPGPDIGLRQLLIETGGPLEDRSIELLPVPGTSGDSVSFGVTAANALAAGTIDAFWANGMGAEVALRRGGRVIHDARRDGLPGADYTFPALMVTRRLAEQEPEIVRAAARAIGRAQQVLREDPAVAGWIGGRLFPALEAGLISGIISRDLPWYTPEITPSAVAGLNAFAQAAGLLTEPAKYEDVVATCAVEAWHLPASSESVQ
jgi:NitT/TauT family transport system substrate-binding protein